MKKFLGAIAVAIIFVSCGESGEQENNTSVASSDTTGEARVVGYQPVIAGTYLGIVPCADCEGIETRVTLFADTSYQLVMTYLGKGPKDTAGLNQQKSGKYMMVNDTMQFEGHEIKFLKTDTALIQLDLAGKLITGKLADKYVLKKLQ